MSRCHAFQVIRLPSFRLFSLPICLSLSTSFGSLTTAERQLSGYWRPNASHHISIGYAYTSAPANMHPAHRSNAHLRHGVIVSIKPLGKSYMTTPKRAQSAPTHL
ncbi:hypothetical protein F5Y09DRAFT_302427, partial [Xylaria sp. FL1042]